MFYLEEFDKETLRFGDVLQGYIHSELIKTSNNKVILYLKLHYLIIIIKM